MSSTPSTIIPGLGGYVCIRNNHELDYCVELSIASMLPLCEQVVVCDSDSTDGTKETLQRMAEKEPRIKLINMPWRNPRGVSHHYWVEWLNFARQHLDTKYQVTVDADEVIDDSPECWQALREACATGNPSRWWRRNNYWKDPSLVIPPGYCCSHRVVRSGLTERAMPSDQPVHPGEYPLVDEATEDNRLLVHHLGFLRDREKFYRKSERVLMIWFARGDERISRAEKEGKQLWESEAGAEYNDKLVKHSDRLPDAVQRWLAERGHSVSDYLPALPPSPPEVFNIITPRRSEPMPMLHSGDFGDAIHCLAICKAIGSVDFLAIDRGINKPLLHRLHLLQPLLESQPYINSVRPYQSGEEVAWNASDFRTRHRWSQSLTQSHLLHYQAQSHLPPIAPDFRKPWITGITPDPRAKGRVLVHRTERYNTENFPWKKIFNFYGSRIMIVGTEQERGNLTAYAGEAEYVPTADLLEVAQLVAGADLVIAGQSCVLAIAEAMKRPRIAEISPSQPDVIVAISKEAQYVADGNVRLPDVAGSGTTYLSSIEVEWENVNVNISPPGGWQHPDMSARPMHINAAVSMLAGIKQIPLAEAKVMIVRHNVERCPDFYTNPGRRQAMATYELALQNALR